MYYEKYFFKQAFLIVYSTSRLKIRVFLIVFQSISHSQHNSAYLMPDNLIQYEIKLLFTYKQLSIYLFSAQYCCIFEGTFQPFHSSAQACLLQ
jgi:hypothetical protein